MKSQEINTIEKISSDSNLKPDRLKHSLLSQSVAQTFKLLVSIGISGWTARYLGAENLGTLSYVAALAGILGPFGNLGVTGSLSALLCEERPLPGLVSSALLIELIGTLIFAVVLAPFAFTTKDPLIAGLILLAVAGNLLGSGEVFEVELLNRERGTLLARIGTIQTIAGAGISALALLAQAPLLVFGGLPAIQSAIKSFLLAIAVKATKPFQLVKQASWKTSRALLKRGLPLLLGGLSVMCYMKSDQVMLEWLRGPTDVGQYSVAVRVAESLFFLPTILASTFLPKIGSGSGQFETDPALKQLYQSSWILGVTMVAVTIIILPQITITIFGEDFKESIIALKYLSPCGFAVASGAASNAWLNRRGGSLLKIIPIRTAAAMALNIGLNAWLIPLTGIAGAAIATTVSYYFATFAVMLCFSTETRRNVVHLIAPLQIKL